MKKLKIKIEELNLNYKKEILGLALINLILIALVISLYFFNISLMIVLCSVLSIPFFNYYYLTRYDTLLRKKDLKLDDEFIELFSYLRIYLFNNETVYSALRQISEFSSSKMKERIALLLDEIDQDKTVQPFINFSKLFKNKVIEEVMISLYEMVNTGNDDIFLNQFIKVFEDFKSRHERELEEKRYSKFDTFNMLSLIGSGIIMIILSLSVISLIGEVSNGF